MELNFDVTVNIKTKIADTKDPEEAKKLLSKYLEYAVDGILNRDGLGGNIDHTFVGYPEISTIVKQD